MNRKLLSFFFLFFLFAQTLFAQTSFPQTDVKTIKHQVSPEIRKEAINFLREISVEVNG